MIIKIENLGIIEYAELSMKELTIICGKNNTGKTYAAYALFGFLHFWHHYRSPIRINIKNYMEALLDTGTASIDLNLVMKNAQSILDKTCERYSERLPKTFAGSPKQFENTRFSIDLEEHDIQLKQSFKGTIGSAKREILTVTKEPDTNHVNITLLVTDKQSHNTASIQEALELAVQNAIKDIVFDTVFPKPFIASAERTGAAIFRKELDFARNRLIEQLGEKGDFDPLEILFNSDPSYALPVAQNVDFARSLEDIAKKESFIAKEHPDIIDDFTSIVGGKYQIFKNKPLTFSPKTKGKFTLKESSSSVRSLLDIGFYLRHLAQKGDLFIIDEPELNLHPDNQRLIARLFTRLINIGIRIFITTHSDYLIRELNILIMLNQNMPHIQTVIKKHSYKKDEILDYNKAQVYIAEKARISIPSTPPKKKTCFTLTAAPITPERGIDATSFNKSLDDMNSIEDDIIWGDDES